MVAVGYVQIPWCVTYACDLVCRTRRVTKDLFKSHKARFLACLASISNSDVWTSDIRDMATYLRRYWKAIASGYDESKAPGATRSKGKASVDKNSRAAKGPSRAKSRQEFMGDSATPEAFPSPTKPRSLPTALWNRLQKEFNPSQLRAVSAAVASSEETEAELSRVGTRGKTEAGGASPSVGIAIAGGAGRVAKEAVVVLLQGPPGTGKTRTVRGVVSAILACQKQHGGVPLSPPAVPGHGGQRSEAGKPPKRSRFASRWTATTGRQRVGEHVGLLWSDGCT